MGRLGYTYGSEWHLLRFLGYHRNELNRRIEEIIPGNQVKVINWIDFHSWEMPVANLLPPVIHEPRILDAERTGYDFLPAGLLQDIPPEWRVFFPPGQQGEGPQNWDAVGQIEIGGETCWLIVEAKGNLTELRSRCQAGGQAFALIQQAFEQVRADWNERPILNWFDRYYQFCNRLAFLHFLRANSINAKLLLIYFLGDRHPRGRVVCPANQAGWADSITLMENHVGWNDDSPLAEHVHKLFLPVCPEVQP